MTELGPGVVIDADKMKVGTYHTIAGELVKIARADHQSVCFQPVVGSELLVYRIKRHWEQDRILILITLFVGASILLYVKVTG